MKFVRFAEGNRIAYGIASQDSVEEISSTPFLPWEATGISHPLEGLRLLAPCLPSKIVCIGLNYKQHAAEIGMEPALEPMFFFKPSTAVIGPGGSIVRPPGSSRLDYEGELAVVIGSVARSVPAERFADVVVGYTCGVDATARDQQRPGEQWGRAKGFDTSAPLGPWIDTEADPADLHIVTRVNGEVKQDARTSDLIFSVGELVSSVTSSVTLLPGDVILTGTPPGVGPLSDGDRLVVEIENIGALEVGVGRGAA